MIITSSLAFDEAARILELDKKFTEAFQYEEQGFSFFFHCFNMFH